MAVVLIVDDDPHLRELLGRICAAAGLDSKTAADGIEALEMVNQHCFDLMLLDISMPRLDGMGVLARLKQQPPAEPLPVIVVTALDDVHGRMRATELGAIDFIGKPFRPANLQRRLQRVLKISELERMLRSEEADLRRLRGGEGGMGGFRELHDALERAVSDASTSGDALCCMVLAVDLPESGSLADAHKALTERVQAISESIGGAVADRGRSFRVDAAEFVVLRPGLTGSLAKEEANGLLAAAREAVSGASVQLSAGLAVFPHPDIDQPSVLYRAANIALAQSRAQGVVVQFEGF